MRRLLFLLVCCALSSTLFAQAAAPTASQNPSAVIKTTDGNFTCELFKDKVPRAVDNFIGLATGTKAWRDPFSHEKKVGKPLYNGTIFHRVIPDFMIQGGDPMGNGSGDIGFTIKDEYSPSLTFDEPGMLAYANSGPNTNGSQFFITEVPVPYLNPCLDAGGCTRGGRHVPKGYGFTIFGRCSPVSLVGTIARSPRDRNDKPYKPIKILRIQILKPGETASEGPAHPTTTHNPAATHKSSAAHKSTTTPRQ
jgi:peptidyl-prolyl cis-trans isomerase A (cyclophilin A)